MQKLDVFKCDSCGNIVELIHVGGGELVCCGQPMKQMGENTTDAATEKHVPVVEKTESGIKVSVGDVIHPMEEKHYIEWIQVITKDGVSERKFLNPGESPVVEFTATDYEKVREYCNLHGLWKA